MNAGLGDLRPFVARIAEFGNHLWGGLGLSLAAQLCALALLAVSGWFLTGCSLAGVSAVLAEAYDVISPSGAIRALALGRTGFRWGERVVTHDATFRLIGALRVWLFERLVLLSPRQTGNLHAGEVLGRLTKDLDSLDNLYQRLAVPLASALLLLAAAVGFAAVLSVGFAVPLLFLSTLSFFILPPACWHSGRQLAPALVRSQGLLRRRLLDTLDALDELALHAPARERQNAAVGRCDTDRLEQQGELLRLGFGFKALIGLAGGLVAWTILGTAALVPPDARLDGPLLVGFVLVVLGLPEFLGALPAMWLELPGTAEAAARLSRVANQTPSPSYVDQSTALPQNSSLVIRGLRFFYGDHCVLANLSLEFPEGTHVVLSGPSGGGKTTLVRLLTRFEDPDAGSISLGGVVFPSLDETTLRRHIACAAQDPWLFADTVAGNLRLASSEATDEALWEVLAVVGLEATLRAWPEGLSTWVDEGGESLSGGQRRRLVLARALLRQAPITILDEPTEGLDDEAAEELVAAVRSHLAGKTLLWVSHRPIDRAGFENSLELEGGFLSGNGMTH